MENINPVVESLSFWMPWITLLAFIVFPVSYICLCWKTKSRLDYIENLPLAFSASIGTIVFGGGGVFIIAVSWELLKAAWAYAMTAFN